MWSLPGPSRQANKSHSPRCHRRPNGPGPLADKVVQPTTQSAEGCTLAASNLPPTTYTYHIQLINPCVMPGPQIPYSRGIDVCIQACIKFSSWNEKVCITPGFFLPLATVTNMYWSVTWYGQYTAVSQCQSIEPEQPSSVRLFGGIAICLWCYRCVCKRTERLYHTSYLYYWYT